MMWYSPSWNDWKAGELEKFSKQCSTCTRAHPAPRVIAGYTLELQGSVAHLPCGDMRPVIACGVSSPQAHGRQQGLPEPGFHMRAALTTGP
jgi:hypothetical protein